MNRSLYGTSSREVLLLLRLLPLLLTSFPALPPSAPLRVLPQQNIKVITKLPGDNGPHEGVMSVAPKCSSSCSTRRESHAERQTFNTRSARHITANSSSAHGKSWVTQGEGTLRHGKGASRGESWAAAEDPAAEESPKSFKEPLLCLRQSTIMGVRPRSRSKPRAIIIIITSACKTTAITSATNADA